MPRVRVIHWRATEGEPLIEACRAICRAFRSKPPDVVVIDLTRLPSHGKEVSVWLRNTKSTRDISIVFTRGGALKVAAIRELLPDATFCETGKVVAAIKLFAAREFGYATGNDWNAQRRNRRRMRAMAPRAKLWLLWRRGSNGFAGAGLRQNMCAK